MRFGHSVYFNLLWLLAALPVFLTWAGNKKRQMLNTFCSPDFHSKLTRQNSTQKQHQKSILLVLTVLFIMLALTRPQWGYQWKDLKQEGVDIIIALDVSNSMLAQDLKPNRLERAKRKITDLLHMMEGDRVGLVAFAGTSFVQCPLTLDYSAAMIFLDILDTDLIPTQGTDLGQAIRTAVEAFSSSEKKSNAIILITDGEDQGGTALEAVELAKEQGVKIFTIGIGQDLGAPIPNPDHTGGFKKDRKGEVVLSKLNESLIQKIALETGGSYVRSVTGDMDLNKIYLEDIKQTVQKKELKTSRRKLWQDRFQWFAFFALLFLTLEFSISERTLRKRP